MLLLTFSSPVMFPDSEWMGKVERCGVSEDGVKWDGGRDRERRKSGGQGEGSCRVRRVSRGVVEELA